MLLYLASVSASTETTSPATVPPSYSGYRAPTYRPADVMAEERPGDRPKVGKSMVKEALADLLDEVPSFWALRAQPGTSTQNADTSAAPPREGKPVHIRIRAKGSLSLWH